MAFFNDLGKKLGEVAGETAIRAKDFADTTKLKTEISSQQKRLQSTYAELGKIYYVQERDVEGSAVADLCAKVEDIQAEIAELEIRIEEIKNN